MAANTRAGRRNGSYKHSQKAIADRSRRNKHSSKRDGGNRSYQSRNLKPDQRIYTVLVSTRGGTAVYKAWEKDDAAMNRHFGDADDAGERFFSFKDIRGKEITNVDLHAGWRYKMTLRWNDEKIARDGSKGDWQDIRKWYEERDSKRHQPDLAEENIHPSRFQGLGEDVEMEEVSPRVLAEGAISSEKEFPSLKVVINTEGAKDEPVLKIHTSSGVERMDAWDDEEDKGQAVSGENDTVLSLEKEKAELLSMLESDED
jgi:hypothetical protein